ncbi:MAG: hypothetical protein ACE5KZ_00620 [Candidatus Scalinduaceae bacterium]
MESRKYHKIRLLRTKNEIWEFFKEKKLYEIATIIIGTIINGILVANKNYNILMSLLYEFIGVIIMFGVLFLWKSLRLVPEDIYEEQQDIINSKQQTIEFLEEQQKPKLRIDFSENNPSYCHDTFQKNKNPNTKHIYDRFERVWRISIHNDSSVTTIKDVKAKLIVEGTTGREEILKFTDNNVQPYRRSVNIAPGECIFVDVLEWYMAGKEEDSLSFDICHIEVDHNYTRIPVRYSTDNGDLKIRIEVFGENIPCQSKCFMVGAKNKDSTIDKIYMWSVD